jgi:ATP-dependent protease ClpP protease subunit
MDGHIFTDEEIGNDYHKVLKAQIDRLNPNVTRIVHHIASPGGSVYGGYKAYHVLKAAGKAIKSIIEGEAQSMATFMAMAGDEIEILDPSTYMIHNPSQGIQGDADALRGGAVELENIQNEMALVYSSKTKIPVEEIKAMMKRETRFTAREAVERGFADKLIGNRSLQPQEYNKLKAVALGETMEKTPIDVLTEKIEALSAQIGANAVPPPAPAVQVPAPAPAPKSVDLALKDGSMLQVPGEDGDLIGRSAMINGGAAPDGTHDLADGRKIIVVGGKITAVEQMPTPEEQAMQALKDQLAQAQADKAQLEAAALEATTAAQTAQTQLQTTVNALAEIKEEVTKIKTKTVGSDNPPNRGMITTTAPTMKASGEDMERTLSFLDEQMPWLANTQDINGNKSALASYKRGPSAVSILETNFNYTYPGLLTTEIFYKPTLQAPALSDIFTIDQGIKFQKQYNLVTQLNKILQPYTGCARTFNGNRQLITNTTVVTKEFQVSEAWCKDDFTGYLAGRYNILAQEWLKTGNKSFDPSGTPINTIIDRILTDALQRDVFRRASFGASNSSDPDYNQIDGLWDRLIDSSGASNYCVVRAGAALGTGTLATNAALTALEAAYASSNILLKNAPNKVFWVTRSIWDNYYNSLIANGAVTQVTEASFENIQKGLQTLTYKGIPVRSVDLWDSFLAESDNPLFAVTRHLILLTVKENHILGVENGADLNKIEGWYERKDRQFYYEADMKFGYNYLHCDLQTIAY